MSARGKLIIYFATAGFLGAVVSTAFLAGFVGPAHSDVILGVPAWSWAAFPFLGAGLAAFWARLLGESGAGPFRGAVVALLAFASFCGLLGLIGLLGGEFTSSAGLLLFGFLLVGWPLLLVGALTGWLFRRNVIVPGR